MKEISASLFPIGTVQRRDNMKVIRPPCFCCLTIMKYDYILFPLMFICALKIIETGKILLVCCIKGTIFPLLFPQVA